MNAKSRGILKRRGIKLRRNNTGFTIFELLVSISIIALLSGLILANYHSANSRLQLTNAAQSLASDIRRQLGYALAAKQSTDTPGILIAPVLNNFYFGFVSDTSDTKVYLPEGITVSSVLGYNSDTSNYIESYALELRFTPPDPSVSLKYSACDVCSYITTNKIRITLKENQGNTTKTIEVNSLGLVDVID